jgi:hypothetical protein
MALTSTKIKEARGSAANGPAAINALIAAEIALGNSPVGEPRITLYQAYPEVYTFSQSVAVGVNTVTAYKMLAANTAAALVTLTNTEVTGGALLLGGLAVLPSQQNTSRATYFQATYKGVAADCGLGAAGAAGAAGVPVAAIGSHSAAYTTVLGDANNILLHPSTDATARIFTIDSNANVAYPIGTTLTFVNGDGAGVLTIKITADEMRLDGAGTAGDRTLAADGVAVARKITATKWVISGGANLT